MIFGISGQPWICWLDSAAWLYISMISVENFYWALYQNLLAPVRLDCWYYYPWGTKDRLTKNVFKPLSSRRDYNHVFFHFDQEPLWSDKLGPYDCTPPLWSNKYVKILANSEISTIKKEICKSRDCLDWYFFYHGFAALDWFRDAQYIRSEQEIKSSFLSLNHVFDNRSHRIALLARLLDKNIAQYGSISFHASVQDVMAELHDPDTKLSQTSQSLIKDHLDGVSDLPWKLDDVPISGELSARFGHNEYVLWQKSLWHLVNETVFYDAKLHLTEKIFKPIVAQRPFILVAAPGNLEYLRRYGFRTFDRWIDESYDHMHDPDQRLDAIVQQISKFANLGVKELEDLRRDMLPVLEYNKQHFFGEFRKIIVSEMVDNFDQCIRIWNNGRVDNRSLPLHPDLENVKKILLN